MAQVVVLGLGRFGGNLARQLYREGHVVLAIDQTMDVVDDIKTEVTEAICMDVRDKIELRQLGLKDYDVAVISIGNLLDVSILASLHCKDLGVPYVVAKAASDDHARILESIGVTEVVFPEKEEAERLARRLGNKNILDHIPLEENFSILEVAPPESFCGKTLAELKLRRKYHIQIIAIKDVLQDHWNLIPAGEDVIKESDILLVLGDNRYLEKLKKL